MGRKRSSSLTNGLQIGCRVNFDDKTGILLNWGAPYERQLGADGLVTVFAVHLRLQDGRDVWTSSDKCGFAV